MIGSNTYDFRLEFTGNLPSINKLTNVAGTDVTTKPVTVVTVLDGTPSGTRYYFMTDGTGSFAIMDAMPNGAIPITNFSTTTSPVLICFCDGTLITTPDGDVPIEDLAVGDLVLNAKGEAVPIRWIGVRLVSQSDLAFYPSLRPVRVPAHTFGERAPSRDHFLSRQHRIVVEGWEVELNFGTDQVLVPVAHLLGDAIHVDHKRESLSYYHLKFDDHEIVMSNGLLTESYQPGAYSVAGLDAEVRDELFALFPELERNDFASRIDALPSLKVREAAILLQDTGLLRTAA